MTSEGYQTQYSPHQSTPHTVHPESAPTPGQPAPQVTQTPGAPGMYPPPGGPPPSATQPHPPHPHPQLQIPQGTPTAPAYPTPTPAAPGFPAPSPGAGYQPGYSPQPFSAVPTAIVYLGTTVPNPDAPPAPHGTLKVPGYFPEKDYEVLKNAKKGLLGGGWNETTLAKMFVGLNPFQADALSDYFSAQTGKTLAEYVPTKTRMNGWFYEVIHGLALGPLGYDAELAKRAIIGAGTNEDLLIELLLSRSNDDIEILKRAYTKKHGSSLVQDVKKDVSGSTKTMFNMALMAQRPAGGFVDMAQVEKDVEDLNQHGLAKGTKLDEILFCQIFINRSDPHITAVIDRYAQKYKSLSKVIKTSPGFAADVKKGLLYIIHSVKSKRNKQEPTGAWRDAKLISKAMKGIGTKDAELCYRIIRASWDPRRMRAVKDAYLQRYGETLEKRVKAEASGSYKAILCELINKT